MRGLPLAFLPRPRTRLRVDEHISLIHDGQYGLGVVFHYDHSGPVSAMIGDEAEVDCRSLRQAEIATDK